MSSSGHIADMIVRMENNRALLKHHRRYKDILEQYANTSLQKPLEWPTMSEAERKELLMHLNQVLQEEKQNNWKALVLSILITGTLIFILAALFRWVFM